MKQEICENKNCACGAEKKPTLYNLSIDELENIVEKIDELVETEFISDMCDRHNSGKPYSWQEAEDMAQVLGKVYLQAHKIHCVACREKQ